MKDKDRYEVRQGKEPGVLIAYLVLFFFACTSGTIIESTLISAMNKLLDQEAELIAAEFPRSAGF